MKAYTRTKHCKDCLFKEGIPKEAKEQGCRPVVMLCHKSGMATPIWILFAKEKNVEAEIRALWSCIQNLLDRIAALEKQTVVKSFDMTSGTVKIEPLGRAILGSITQSLSDGEKTIDSGKFEPENFAPLTLNEIREIRKLKPIGQYPNYGSKEITADPPVPFKGMIGGAFITGQLRLSITRQLQLDGDVFGGGTDLFSLEGFFVPIGDIKLGDTFVMGIETDNCFNIHVQVIVNHDPVRGWSFKSEGPFDVEAIEKFIKSKVQSETDLGEWLDKAKDDFSEPICQMKTTIPGTLLKTMDGYQIRLVAINASANMEYRVYKDEDLQSTHFSKEEAEQWIKGQVKNG